MNGNDLHQFLAVMSSEPETLSWAPISLCTTLTISSDGNQFVRISFCPELIRSAGMLGQFPFSDIIFSSSALSVRRTNMSSAQPSQAGSYLCGFTSLWADGGRFLESKRPRAADLF